MGQSLRRGSKGRAGWGFDVDLVYDSHLYDVVVETDYQWLNNQATTGGWNYNFQNAKLEGEAKPLTQCQTTSDQPYFRLRIGLPDGSVRSSSRSRERNERRDLRSEESVMVRSPSESRERNKATQRGGPRAEDRGRFFETADSALAANRKGGESRWRGGVPDAPVNQRRSTGGL